MCKQTFDGSFIATIKRLLTSVCVVVNDSTLLHSKLCMLLRPMYSCRQKSADNNGTASAEILERMLCAMQMAVRPASVASKRACALAAVTVACAASCKALAKAGE